MTTHQDKHSSQRNRRSWLGVAGKAFCLIPFASLLAEEDAKRNGTKTGANPAPQPARPGEDASPGESCPVNKKISRVVFFYMNGGPSQIDTFDPKPALHRLEGTPYTGNRKIGSGTREVGTLWPSEFTFRKYGESGLEISELYPEVSRFADDLCVIRSLQTPISLHAPAILKLNTGRTQPGNPSLGTWVNYGLGTLNENLPSFVVMIDPRGGPINSHSNWSTGQIPTNPATLLYSTQNPVLYLSRNSKIQEQDDERMRNLLQNLNTHHLTQNNNDSLIFQRMRSYELAWKMQVDTPDAVDLAQETRRTQERYGTGKPQTQTFGTQCLLARRLLERGVRFVQIYSGGGEQKHTWDSHVGNVPRHRQFAGETDLPVAAFLEDLKQSGLWEETLVIWGGEFGRTPTREGNSTGRDHNPLGFTMWLSGGGVRGGHVIGATDEIGFQAVEKVCSVADLHATILHLLGLDHTELNYSQNGVTIGLTGPELVCSPKVDPVVMKV